MKENIICKTTVWLSRLLLLHFLIQEHSSILIVTICQSVQRCSDHLQGVMQGTVPYLGTFLTDLIRLDTALPDYAEVIWGNCLNPPSLPTAVCVCSRIFYWEGVCSFISNKNLE